jgi:3-dehydroquinate dehydratase-2
VINAGALSHYSYAIADALVLFEGPKVEVHLSNLHARAERWRHRSVISPVVDGSITGLKETGYRIAIEAAADLMEKK